MMIKFPRLICIICLIFFVSCKENDFEEALFRTNSDPFQDVPVIDSLKTENTVYLSWSEDIASDKFYLMRAEDSDTLEFKCIYEGTSTSFVDSALAEFSRYVYRLDKIRGQKKFYGNTYAFGYASSVRKDENECNDVESQASFLEYDLVCNLPCVRYISKTEPVIDEDWFFVEIPPLRSASIVLNQTAGLDNQSTGSDTQLMLLVKGTEPISVKQNVENLISNPTYSTRKMYFKVYPTTTGLFSADSYTAVIEYTISLKQVFKYTS